MSLRSPVALVIAVSLWGASCSRPDPRPSSPTAAPPPRAVASNVTRKDYAGSAACVPCHADVSARVQESPMHRMTRALPGAEVEAPFTGEHFAFQGERATMSTHAGERYLEIDSPQRGRSTYRLTKVIGGRYREDFVGVRVSSIPRGDPSAPHERREASREMVLPVTWVRGTREWRYKGYSVQVPERPYLAVGPDWRSSCIFCHNTTPYLTTLYDDLGGGRGYQGAVPSNLLPPDRQLRFEVLDWAALTHEVEGELARLKWPRSSATEPADGSHHPLLRAAVHATRERYDVGDFVELGIGCEACHNGSAAHARDPSLLPSYAPTSSLVSVRTSHGELTRAEAINHTCARCHAVLFSRYPHTWEGGHREQNPGGSTVNSGEARDFLLGGCANQMTCTTCHDPHAEDAPARLAALATPAGNGVCTSCHTQFEGEKALRAHSRHLPSSEGAACVGCHMPRKNAGLNYELTRYHRIGSPTDRARVEGDRPLECALCHGDMSVARLARELEQGWQRKLDPAALTRLYGPDLERPIMELTLERGLPHEQTVAIEWMGRTKDARYLPALAEQLAHELPLNRYFAREAMAKILGERPPLDMSLPGAQLAATARAWLSTRSAPARE